VLILKRYTCVGTLFNYLFGTSFDVRPLDYVGLMTTKGAWMSKAKVGDTQILILDVEGSDSHDRAEDREKS